MRLRDQILASPETLSDLAWAAEQRFLEAEALLVAGRHSGAVYLLGLSAEMWLKLACFYYLRATPTTPVSGQLGPVKTWMRTGAPTVKPGAYHSLWFWAEFLIARRRFDGAGLSSDLAGLLRHHVVYRLYQDWKIDLRYSSLPVSQGHAWRVYNDVWWLRRDWDRLRR